MLILAALKACKPFSFLNGILSSQLFNEVIDEESATLRNKWRLSITTLTKGIVGNKGEWDTLNCFLDFGNAARVIFSFMDRAPSAGSLIDHFFSKSPRSVIGHLHQIHEYLLLAESIPVAKARNFQSPPRK